jgi:hypothetical protein
LLDKLQDELCIILGKEVTEYLLIASLFLCNEPFDKLTAEASGSSAYLLHVLEASNDPDA